MKTRSVLCVLCVYGSWVYGHGVYGQASSGMLCRHDWAVSIRAISILLCSNFQSVNTHCIPPQDPILFTGTLRENMDPFAEYNDGQLWGALESASLKEFISEQENKLDFEIQERGENMRYENLNIKIPHLFCLDTLSFSSNCNIKSALTHYSQRGSEAASLSS